MAGFFDFLTGGDPAQQIAQRLGQAPGQPGSPQGPQPGPQGAPAAGGPPGGPPGQAQQQQQQPQILQSPPDLAQAYLALSQHAQASNQFYNSLALFDAGLYPGRHPEAAMKWAQGMQQDPGSMMSNLMQINQYQQQAQALQAFRAGIPKMLDAAGISQDYAPLVAEDPTLLSKIVEAKAGVGGGPAWMAQQRAEKSLTDAGKPIPWTPGDPSSYDAWTKANTGQALTTAKTKADDLVADQHNFGSALANYDNMIKDSEALLKKPGLDNIVGPTGQYNVAGNPFNSTDTTEALSLYNKIMAGQYAAGVQDFKGAGRITQTELKTDAPSQSVMGSRNLDPAAFRQGVQDYIDKLKQKRANLFGVAQKGDDPRLSDADYTKYVLPNQDLYGGPKRDIKPPDADSSPPASAAPPAPSSDKPPVPGAKKAPDGNWYVPDPNRPGKYQRVG